MDKTASKPMPCPFCGGQPRIEDYDENPVALSHPDARIVCGNHNCCMENHSFSLSNWNRRSPSEPQASVREAAEAAVATMLAEAKLVIPPDPAKWNSPIGDQGIDDKRMAQIIAQAFAGFAPKGGEAVAWMKVTASYDEFHGVTEYDAEFEFQPDKPEGNGWKPLYTHPAQPPAQVDADSAAKEIYTELTDFFGGDDALRHCFTEPEVSSIIRKHIRHTHAPGEGWQWVPKELTKAMHEAAETYGIGHALLNWIWKQLLAAAPATQEDES